MDKLQQIRIATLKGQWLRIQTQTKAVIVRPLQVGSLGANRYAFDGIVAYRDGQKVERFYLDELLHLQLHEFKVGSNHTDLLNRMAASFVDEPVRWKPT